MKFPTRPLARKLPYIVWDFLAAAQNIALEVPTDRDGRTTVIPSIGPKEDFVLRNLKLIGQVDAGGTCGEVSQTPVA